MARHRENLSGGVANVVDASVQKPGQVQQLQNGVYLRGSPVLRRAPGRVVFGAVTASGSDVDGLRDIHFDNGDHYLVAMISGTAAGDGSYRIAPVGDIGTFSTLASSIVGGSQLEVVHYRNRFFLFNGIQNAFDITGSNQVVYLSATGVGTVPTTRQHGMLPVDATPRVTLAAGSFSQTVTGYYEYWTTEIANVTADGTDFSLESAFVGVPATVLVSATGVVPTIQIPAVRNGLTTDWRVYRSPKKDKESDKKFPSGFSISEAATGTSAVSDTITVSATSYAFPANFNGIADAATVYVDAGAGASALGADDAVHAALTTPAASGLAPFTVKSQGCYGFNFGGFSGNIRGIEVEVQAYISSGSAPCAVNVTLGGRRTTTGEYGWNQTFSGPGPIGSARELARHHRLPQPVTKSGAITSTAVGSPTTIVLGSATDRWTPSEGRPLVDLDFTAGSFMALLRIAKPSITLSIDYIKVRVSYAATTESTIQFPTVVYTFGDITSQVAKNGMPPSSSTGDFYEDSLVVNDVSNRALIRYSAPGEPESFPETYFLDFETRDNDRVTNIKVVNGRLVVFLETSAWRANYLPSERDSSFDRGKAVEAISASHGCVNEMCAVRFRPPWAGGELLAFVSDNGIHVTDGFSFETWTEPLLWRNRVGATGRSIIGSDLVTSSQIALIDDRENERLLFYYRNDDIGNESYRCLNINYGTAHLFDGKPIMSGFVNMRNYHAGSTTRSSLESAWPVRRSTGYTDIYLGYGGTATAAGAGSVYRENATVTSLPAQDATLGYRTRRMWVDGFGHEFKLNDFYPYYFIGASATATFVIESSKTNAAAFDVDSGPKSMTHISGNCPLHRLSAPLIAESVIISAAVTGESSNGGFLFLELDYDSLGQQDSGR